MLASLFGGANNLKRFVSRPPSAPLRLALTDVEGRTLGVEAQTLHEGGREHFEFELDLTGNEPPKVKTSTRPEELRMLLGSPAARRFDSAVLLRLDASVMVRPSVPYSEEGPCASPATTIGSPPGCPSPIASARRRGAPSSGRGRASRRRVVDGRVLVYAGQERRIEAVGGLATGDDPEAR